MLTFQFSPNFLNSPRTHNQTGAGGQAVASGNTSTGHNAQHQPVIPMEHMLFSFLNDLITGLSGGGVPVGGGFP